VKNKFVEKKLDESARSNEENMDPEVLQSMKQTREAKEVGEADLDVLGKNGSHAVGSTMGKLALDRINAAFCGKSLEYFL